jgi:SAM-dependent methyltransferase
MFTHSAHFYDLIYDTLDYRSDSEALHALVERCKRTRGNALLDVACGTGNHLVHLREHYAVEGLELDQRMVELARAKLGDIPVHAGDMSDFALGREFDVVVCLFSAIGYVATEERLRSTLRCFARHLRPGGVVVIEPWILPEKWKEGTLHAMLVDRPEVKLARMSVSRSHERVAVLDLHYLVATEHGIERFEERHELGLFSDAQYREAFELAGLTVERAEGGVAGRGWYIGVKSTTDYGLRTAD